jgi:[calcium/calmodulin-dependent protein kinase] kinase
VQPPLQLDGQDGRTLQRTKSYDLDNRRPIEGAMVVEGVHRTIENHDIIEPLSLDHRMDSPVTLESMRSQPEDQSKPPFKAQHSFDVAKTHPHLETRRTQSASDRGHAHDPMAEEPHWLGIGGGCDDNVPPGTPACAESPTAAEFDIYDTAYQREVERIRKAKGEEATVFLTRRVDSKKEYKKDTHMIDAPSEQEVKGQAHEGWKSVLDAAREKQKKMAEPLDKGIHHHTLTDVAAHAGQSTRAAGDRLISKGQEASEKGGAIISNVVHKAMDYPSAKGE